MTTSQTPRWYSGGTEPISASLNLRGRLLGEALSGSDLSDEAIDRGAGSGRLRRAGRSEPVSGRQGDVRPAPAVHVAPRPAGSSRRPCSARAHAVALVLRGGLRTEALDGDGTVPRDRTA